MSIVAAIVDAGNGIRVVMTDDIASLAPHVGPGEMCYVLPGVEVDTDSIYPTTTGALIADQAIAYANEQRALSGLPEIVTSREENPPPTDYGTGEPPGTVGTDE